MTILTKWLDLLHTRGIKPQDYSVSVSIYISKVFLMVSADCCFLSFENYL